MLAWLRCMRWAGGILTPFPRSPLPSLTTAAASKHVVNRCSCVRKLDAVARPEQILVRDPQRGCDVEATWTRCQTTGQIACGVGLCGSAPDDCIHHRYQIPLFVRPGSPLVCHCVIRVAHRHYHESRLSIACALNFHPSGPRPPLPNSRQNGITLAQTTLNFYVQYTWLQFRLAPYLLPLPPWRVKRLQVRLARQT